MKIRQVLLFSSVIKPEFALKLRGMQTWERCGSSCPTLTCLHKLQGYEVVSILFPNGRRQKHLLRITYPRRKMLGKVLGWELFVGQRIMANVEKRLKTEILVEKYPKERLRALDWGLPMARRRDIFLRNRRQMSSQGEDRKELWHWDKGYWGNSVSYQQIRQWGHLLRKKGWNPSLEKLWTNYSEKCKRKIQRWMKGWWKRVSLA